MTGIVLSADRTLAEDPTQTAGPWKPPGSMGVTPDREPSLAPELSKEAPLL